MEANDGTATAVATDERRTAATPQPIATDERAQLAMLDGLIRNENDLIPITVRPQKGNRNVGVTLHFFGMSGAEVKHYKQLAYGGGGNKPKPRQARAMIIGKVDHIDFVDLTRANAEPVRFTGDPHAWLEFDRTGQAVLEWLGDLYVNRAAIRVKDEAEGEDED